MGPEGVFAGMKTRSFVALVALLAAAFAAAPAARAESAGGTYQFSFDDGRAKYVEFDARGLAGGGATGRMYFSDDAVIRHQDVDGVGDPFETYNGFYMSAEFDSMSVSGSRAVIAGTVRDSNIRSLVGRRVLLTVEDNGDNT